MWIIADRISRARSTHASRHSHAGERAVPGGWTARATPATTSTIPASSAVPSRSPNHVTPIASPKIGVTKPSTFNVTSGARRSSTNQIRKPTPVPAARATTARPNDSDHAMFARGATSGAAISRTTAPMTSCQPVADSGSKLAREPLGEDVTGGDPGRAGEHERGSGERRAGRRALARRGQRRDGDPGEREHHPDRRPSIDALVEHGETEGGGEQRLGARDHRREPGRDAAAGEQHRAEAERGPRQPDPEHREPLAHPARLRAPPPRGDREHDEAGHERAQARDVKWWRGAHRDGGQRQTRRRDQRDEDAADDRDDTEALMCCADLGPRLGGYPRQRMRVAARIGHSRSTVAWRVPFAGAVTPRMPPV